MQIISPNKNSENKDKENLLDHIPSSFWLWRGTVVHFQPLRPLENNISEFKSKDKCEQLRLRERKI